MQTQKNKYRNSSKPQKPLAFGKENAKEIVKVSREYPTIKEEVWFNDILNYFQGDNTHTTNTHTHTQHTHIITTHFTTTQTHTSDNAPVWNYSSRDNIANGWKTFQFQSNKKDYAKSMFPSSYLKKQLNVEFNEHLFYQGLLTQTLHIAFPKDVYHRYKNNEKFKFRLNEKLYRLENLIEYRDHSNNKQTSYIVGVHGVFQEFVKVCHGTNNFNCLTGEIIVLSHKTYKQTNKQTNKQTKIP